MRLLVIVVSAALTVAGFPPFGWGAWAVVPGLAGLIWVLHDTVGWWRGALYGLIWGLVFYGGLMWWMAELEVVAMVALTTLLAAFVAVFGAVSTTRWSYELSPWARWLLLVGLWAALEWIRYRFPLGGLEWGTLGYALGEHRWLRGAAAWVGTSGLTTMVVALAAAVTAPNRVRATPVTGLAVLLLLGAMAPAAPSGDSAEVAIVQGSTPCPFTHCPDERFGTFSQHLESTRELPANTFDLVVWSEGSLGSTNADPTNNPEVAESMEEEVRRLDSNLLAGSDRVLSETHWENVNIMWNRDGTIQGEYRKQHPVPFGEYIPARSLFGELAMLAPVPRDAIPGIGPVVFDVDGHTVGSVISFEGAFSRYARQHARAGAQLLVVATNEGSYGHTPVSDQLIGMTRMRAAETGLDVVHAAVTGKSVLITDGGVVGPTTELGTVETLTGAINWAETTTLFVRWGNWIQLLLIVISALFIGSTFICRPPWSQGFGPFNN